MLISLTLCNNIYMKNVIKRVKSVKLKILKSDSHVPKKIFLFALMITFQK